MNLMQISNALSSKEIGTVELTKYYLDKIKEHNKTLNCFITICEESALAAAKSAQKRIDNGSASPLTGIPIAIKDNICTKGIKTTCASKMLSDFIPNYNATAAERLVEGGAVILGKTNMDEFAMGSSSKTSYYGGVKNPYNLSKLAGGSSGGSAAAVSAGLCPIALGSDTGGSVRQPAAFCGVTGLKPTYGTVSRYGLIAFASSLEQIGILANSAQDCGFLLDCIYGKDNLDATTSEQAKGNYSIISDIKNCKIGIPKEFFAMSNSSEVMQSVISAVEYYKALGCEIIECSLPGIEFCVSAYYLISSAEAASNLARYDGIRMGMTNSNASTYEDLIKSSRSEGFGKEVKRRILLGNYALSEGFYNDYYMKAKKIALQIKKEYQDVFQKCDFILTPTTLTTAYDALMTHDDPTKMYLDDICTVSANLAGLPAISTPCGYDSEGMPIGMTLTGKKFDERTLISACTIFEKNFSRKEVAL